MNASIACRRSSNFPSNTLCRVRSPAIRAARLICLILGTKRALKEKIGEEAISCMLKMMLRALSQGEDHLRVGVLLHQFLVEGRTRPVHGGRVAAEGEVSVVPTPSSERTSRRLISESNTPESRT